MYSGNAQDTLAVCNVQGTSDKQVTPPTYLPEFAKTHSCGFASTQRLRTLRQVRQCSLGAQRAGQFVKVDHRSRNALAVWIAVIQRDQLLLNSNKERPVVVTRIGPDKVFMRKSVSVRITTMGSESHTQ